MTGIVFNIQRFSLFDGPGVRTVVFLKGCPLRCIWCHNPEGLEKYPQIMYDPTRCIGCGECASVCPNGLHIMREGLHGYIRQNCTGCGKCAQNCCTDALSLAGETMDVSGVMSTVMRDLPVYKESGGGITISGCEPFYQADFTISLLKASKKAGISTCIETCGHADGAKIEEAAAFTDLFLYDYKATGDEMHRELCGVPQTVILKNLARLDALGSNVILRCPIVSGANDLPIHINGIAEIARMASKIARVTINTNPAASFASGCQR